MEYITIGEVTIATPSESKAFIWGSDLERDVCPFCDTATCFYDCDGSKAEFEDGSNPDETEEEIISRAKYNASLDVVESLTLALVSSLKAHQIVIEDDLKTALEEAFQTTVDAMGNNT